MVSPYHDSHQASPIMTPFAVNNISSTQGMTSTEMTGTATNILSQSASGDLSSTLQKSQQLMPHLYLPVKYENALTVITKK